MAMLRYFAHNETIAAPVISEKPRLTIVPGLLASVYFRSHAPTRLADKREGNNPSPPPSAQNIIV
jgi:hypothetical protein